MLKFISFGSGSSGNSYCLFTEDEGLLIDAGLGIRTLKKYSQQYGINLSSIQHILITHDHADHVKSVGKLSSTFNIPVYATQQVHEGIMRNYCVNPKIDANLMNYIEKDVPITLGDFRVTAFPVPHDSADCVGYKIEYKDVVFCLMTDVGHITPQLERHIHEANYLVLESNHDEKMVADGPYPSFLKERILGSKGHLSNRVSAETLAKNASNNLRQVWLCHLSEENNHPVLVEKTFLEVLSSHALVVGESFQLEVLKRKLPSKIYTLE